MMSIYTNYWRGQRPFWPPTKLFGGGGLGPAAPSPVPTPMHSRGELKIAVLQCI